MRFFKSCIYTLVIGFLATASSVLAGSGSVSNPPSRIDQLRVLVGGGMFGKVAGTHNRQNDDALRATDPVVPKQNNVQQNILLDQKAIDRLRDAYNECMANKRSPACENFEKTDLELPVKPDVLGDAGADMNREFKTAAVPEELSESNMFLWQPLGEPSRPVQQESFQRASDETEPPANDLS